jgi:colanic acid/amylovoran biosynthesis protein
MIAETIKKDIKNDIEIIKEDNPLKIKSLIGMARIVISSRYHGIVNALNQGVPVLGTSWSHKYQTLFDEYSFQGGLCDCNADLNTIERKISEMTNNYDTIHKELLAITENNKKKTEKMWDEIFTCINN